MKNFWALPPMLRLGLCSRAMFSVQNDLLAFPQYEIIYSQTFISSAEAQARLAFAHSPSPENRDQYLAAAAPAPDAEPDLLYDVATQEWKLEGVRYPTSSQDSYERMVLRGHPYLCTIPHVPPPEPDNSTMAMTDEDSQQELARASEKGWQLLQGMEGHCLYYPHFTGSWWVYSFCYNDGIRQFHPVEPGRGIPPYPPIEDPNVASYTLARFKHPENRKEPAGGGGGGGGASGGSSLEEEPDESQNSELEVSSSQLQTRGEMNYLVQKLGGGTICDLTGYERRVEVQFHCNPGTPDRIQMIKEIASCVYLIVIHTPRLCSDVAFLPPETEKPNPVTCQEIVTPEELPAWKKRQAAKAERYFFSQNLDNKATSPGRIKVGDVEVGAQRWVGGSPERTIKASNIITGAHTKKGKGQEKLIATLAKSDGKYTTSMSEQEMKRLGVKTDKKELDKWIATILNDAPREGMPWKLIAVRTAEGYMEFRAILGTDEDDGDLTGEPTEEDKGGKEAQGSEGSQEEYK